MLEFKTGDNVVVKRSGKTYLTKIKRTTKTLYITDDNFRFNKDSLNIVGYNSYGYGYGRIIQNPTQEILDVIEKENCINILKDTNWENLTLIKLQEIVKYIKEQEGE